MFHKILIPLDGSSASEVALVYLDHLRSEEILLARIDSPPSAALEESMNYLKAVRARLPSMLDVQLACEPGEPAQALLRLAEAAGCDLILMTSQGHLWEKVTQHATCPVFLVGLQAVVAVPDPAAQAALERAQELVEGCL